MSNRSVKGQHVLNDWNADQLREWLELEVPNGNWKIYLMRGGKGDWLRAQNPADETEWTEICLTRK